MKQVVVLSEGLIERGSTSQFPVSGDGIAMAVAAALLNEKLAAVLERDPVTVAFLSALGDDPEGQLIRDFCRLRNVATDWVAMMPLLPDETGALTRHGTASWQYVEAGRPAKYYNRDAENCPIDRLFRDQAPPVGAFLQTVDADTLFVVSGIAVSRPFAEATLDAMLALVAEAKRRGATVLVDPNTRLLLFQTPQEAGRRIGKLLALADVALPSWPLDVDKIFDWADEDAVVKGLVDGGVRHVIVKRGENGSTYRESQGEGYALGAPQGIMQPNHSGAGDAYVGALALGLCQGLTIKEAMRLATLAAEGKLRTRGSATLAEEFAPGIEDIRAVLEADDGRGFRFEIPQASELSN